MQDVTIETFVEDVPCGKCITTRHIDSDGVVIRQDIEIQVDKGLVIGAEQGEIG